jgi:hypothetical protein
MASVTIGSGRIIVYRVVDIRSAVARFNLREQWSSMPE